jgi:hypothetical protein
VGDDPGGGLGGVGGKPPGGNYPGGTRRRFILRGEVVEWDLLHWFDRLDYFPLELFSGR